MLDRGRCQVLAVALAVLLGAAACSSGSSSGLPTPPFSDPCAAKPQGGALCIKVLATKGVVGDVIGYLSSTESPLAGQRWRLVLSSYRCDPGTDVTPACSSVTTYPTAARHGTPPIETSCRLSNGETNTTSPGCHNTLAAEYASHGDWRGFPLTGPGFTVRHETWLCVSEQTADGTWNTPAPAIRPVPVRACAAVAPA